MAGRATADSGIVRIIGGKWRGRKLSFPAQPGLRPTPDRVRETLFNWLAAELPDARCLDLFAGSGALGLEALSRGARSCQFVDSARPACDSINRHLVALDCRDGQVLHGDTLDWLERKPTPQRIADIVFLDPPFDSGLLEPICVALESRGWLGLGSCVYVEHSAREAALLFPEQWQAVKDKSAGEVRYRLFVHD
jgi:16S rRNA (guanine966-N2)-methyltransferase